MSENKSEGSGAAPLAPQTEDVTSQMLAAMLRVAAHLDEFAYLENQKAKLIGEEIAKELAAEQKREEERRRRERLSLAATALNGLLCSGGRAEPNMVAVSFAYADALTAASLQEQPRAAPSEAIAETREEEETE